MNTRGSALLLGAAALALLAHVSTALGAGKITGLTLNLPAVKTCVLETIRVTGTADAARSRSSWMMGQRSCMCPAMFPLWSITRTRSKGPIGRQRKARATAAARKVPYCKLSARRSRRHICPRRSGPVAVSSSRERISAIYLASC
jgi:hypothetical protein